MNMFHFHVRMLAEFVAKNLSFDCFRLMKTLIHLQSAISDIPVSILAVFIQLVSVCFSSCKVH